MPEVIRPDGAVIHYRVAGTGPAVLALAPGGVSSAASQWQHGAVGALESLTDRFRVITMDQRYAGRSRAPLSPFTYEDALADQIAVLDAAGARRAHVLGESFGAAFALRLTYDAPARVGAVCLVHPVGIDATNDIGAYYAVFNETIRIARAEGIDGVIAAAESNGCFTDNPAAGPWAQRLHDEPGFRDTLRALGRELYITLVVDFRDGFCPWGKRFFAVNDLAVERIRAPMLVVPGADKLHPADVGTTLCAAAANAECAPGISGAGLRQRVCDFFEANPNV